MQENNPLRLKSVKTDTPIGGADSGHINQAPYRGPIEVCLPSLGTKQGVLSVLNALGVPELSISAWSISKYFENIFEQSSRQFWDPDRGPWALAALGPARHFRAGSQNCRFYCLAIFTNRPRWTSTILGPPMIQRN